MKTTTSPVSVRLNSDLIKRATAFARKRKIGLTTALRLMVTERLDAEESAADLDAVLHWQRQQAWVAFERWEQGAAREVTLDGLRSAHGRALIRATKG